MMDTLFVLGQESRLRILEQAASRIPGCVYLCVWAPIPGGHHPPRSAAASRAHRHLLCLDAWLRDGGGSGDSDRARALFDAYRGSLCAAVSGCVPGWAYGDGRAYMELPEHDLALTASSPVQQQFYQEAGIKVAAFMGCESGEIEVGLSTPAGQTNLQASLGQVFSEDFFQQSLLEELLQLPPTRPSSSSSSLPSISVGSPADGSTSLLRSTMAAMSSTTTSPRDLTAAQMLHPLRPPHPVPFSRHGPGHGHLHFPSAEADDAAMAQAMLTVISSSSSSSGMPTTSMPIVPGNHRARRSPRRGSTTTAFRAYNAALAPRAPRRAAGAPGQRMIKMAISILRRMQEYNGQERRSGATAQRWREDDEETAAASAPAAAPTSSQLHHMISERRRRERLNESFETLRGLLPPGSKKDKATVLAHTLDYMNIMMTQISELEAKNRSLQAAAQTQRHQRAVNGSSRDRPLLQAGGSSVRVQVDVTSSSAGASTSSSSFSPADHHREVTIRVAAPGDLSELLARVLAVLKGMAGHRFTVVAVDGRRPDTNGDGIARASLTLRATVAGEIDEASLREAVAKAVVGLVTPAPSDDDESP
ncbi:putative transcription factor bHLH041 [Lolium perenne]|uniref:putative transcription factor bHLH041 n=1 Tax=Lolium perenne TaxID=4522 RepID=UPI0021EB0F85|nr:putative transcription factor bHLH041 [Lolium perenne]